MPRPRLTRPDSTVPLPAFQAAHRSRPRVSPADLRAVLGAAELHIRADERQRVGAETEDILASLREDAALLKRNWHADRDKIVKVRQLAESLGDRTDEPQGGRPSDRRVVEPIQRMLYAILDGTDG